MPVVQGQGSTDIGAYTDSVSQWHKTRFKVPGHNQKGSTVPTTNKGVCFRSSRSTPPIAMPTSRVNEFIGFELGLVPEVEYVFAALRGDVFYVWVVVNEFTPEVRQRIYERERAVIDEFSDFEFDFYIIARMNREITELISDAEPVYPHHTQIDAQ